MDKYTSLQVQGAKIQCAMLQEDMSASIRYFHERFLDHWVLIQNFLGAEDCLAENNIDPNDTSLDARKFEERVASALVFVREKTTPFNEASEAFLLNLDRLNVTMNRLRSILIPFAYPDLAHVFPNVIPPPAVGSKFPPGLHLTPANAVLMKIFVFLADGEYADVFPDEKTAQGNPPDIEPQGKARPDVISWYAPNTDHMIRQRLRNKDLLLGGIDLFGQLLFFKSKATPSEVSILLPFAYFLLTADNPDKAYLAEKLSDKDLIFQIEKILEPVLLSVRTSSEPNVFAALEKSSDPKFQAVREIVYRFYDVVADTSLVLSVIAGNLNAQNDSVLKDVTGIESMYNKKKKLQEDCLPRLSPKKKRAAVVLAEKHFDVVGVDALDHFRKAARQALERLNVVPKLEDIDHY